MRCTTYCTADSYRINELLSFFESKNLKPKHYDGVIHLSVPLNLGESLGDAFFFSYGCTTFWGFETEEEQDFLKMVHLYESGSIQPHIVDQSTYLHGDETSIDEENDQIILGGEDVLIKLSITHGLTQSVKLSSFENFVDATIESLGDLPQQFALRGKIPLSRQKLSQKIGELFAVRHKINLHSDILDTPEFFWRRPRYEPYYLIAIDYMDIETRIEILNKRLDVVREFYEILSNELNHLHSLRLEIVIILLIAIEVFLALYKWH